ncbi:MAG TPA: penicillin-binding protein 2 [Elainellaceae cyanobacterium]
MTLTQHSPLSRQPKSRQISRTVGKSFRSLIIMLIVSLILPVGMGSRLAYLQLVQGDRNRQLAEDNRIRLIPKNPERGKILDRNGKILVGSRLSYSVYLWPISNKQREWTAIARRLSQILEIPADEIQKRLGQAGYDSPFLVRIARGISPAKLTALAEYSQELKGVQVEAETERNYPYGDLAAHVLGYTGEMSDEELQRYQDQGYRLGDVIGQMGVEAAFEPRLRGEWGGQQVEVDGAGRVLRILGEKISQPGNDVHLTLDISVQQAAEKALGERTGAIVALDPRNGAVLAMVSRPAFDPNIFSTHITDAQWQQLQSKEYPFLNRALQGYPPASTFKIATTTAAIESGRFSPRTVLQTYPFITAGGIQFWDWNRAGFGPLGFIGAMAWSSDTFFYQTAMRMGEQPLIQWTRRYGFGQKTGIEIASEESSGLVPDEEWKLEEIGEPWYQGDTINMSIGQGYMQSSPLQVAIMFAVVANGGDRVTPHLLKDDEAAQTWRESIGLQPETLRVLQKGLRQVITGGTGTALNVSTLPPVAGKSGTAEDPPRDSHTWFGAYAPYDNPEIVVVAFGENSGGGGGSVAAPMVRQVLEAYFNGTQPTETATPSAVITD